MKPLPTEAMHLLGRIIEQRPYRFNVDVQQLDKLLAALSKRGLIHITGEGGQWERFFPTQSASWWYRWQQPLEKSRLEKLK